MDTERFLQAVASRLGHLSEVDRGLVMDTLREEVLSEESRSDSPLVDAERERRYEAETLREILEAINRQARLEETIEEVLRQLSRIVPFDSCSLSLLENDMNLRTIATRGKTSRQVGSTFRNPVTEKIRESRLAETLEDAAALAAFHADPETRSWAGLPLLVEGEMIGLLALERHTVAPFGEEDLHRAKAVAFSAGAAIRKARLLDQVRRYAALMERVVGIDQAVFLGHSPDAVARLILSGAMEIGGHSEGLLVLLRPTGATVAATVGDSLRSAEGRRAPEAFVVREGREIRPEQLAGALEELGIEPKGRGCHIVPLSSPDALLGTLVLLDASRAGSDDSLLEAFTSRASTAYLHALRD